MPFIVTEPCIRCKYTACVAVCPMDCFIEGSNFLVIDPVACIECSICVPECPVGAIVDAVSANEAQRPYIALNARLATDARWTAIKHSKSPPEDHADWREVREKFHLLEAAT